MVQCGIGFFVRSVTEMTNSVSLLDRMIRLVVLFSLGLSPAARAEVISTTPACDIPADLPPTESVAVEESPDLTRIELPRIAIELKQGIPVNGQTFAEALLAQITVDPNGGTVALDGEGNLFAAPQRARCD